MHNTKQQEEQTSAQYWTSGGNLGGGLGRSASIELGLNVNCLTREKTLILCGGGAGRDGIGNSFVMGVEEEEEEEEEEKGSAPWRCSRYIWIHSSQVEKYQMVIQEVAPGDGMVGEWE